MLVIALGARSDPKVTIRGHSGRLVERICIVLFHFSRICVSPTQNVHFRHLADHREAVGCFPVQSLGRVCTAHGDVFEGAAKNDEDKLKIM